ncbi:MAG: hypothetical protein EOM10_17970, partial [Opitutae bacterium]|nr:hypothetical protein [Opitutae bacterium]
LYADPVMPPHLRNYCYPYGRLPDLNLLSQAHLQFTGTHDFSQFSYGYGDEELSKTRKIFYFRAKQRGKFVFFFVKGEGFLRGMIRSLVGASLSCAEGGSTAGATSAFGAASLALFPTRYVVMGTLVAAALAAALTRRQALRT